MSSRKKLFVENFLIYGAINGINKIIPLIMLPLITILLGSTTEFGKFDMFLTIVSFGASFAMLGIYDALFREYFEKDDEIYKKKIISTSLIVVTISSIVVFLTMIIIKEPLMKLFFNDFNSYGVIILAAIAIVLTTIQGILAAPTRVENQRKVYLYSGIFYSLIYYVLSVLFIELGYGFKGLLYGNILAIVFLILFFWRKNFKYFSIGFYDKNIAFSLLKIGLPLMPTFLSYWIFKSMDRVFISNILGLKEVGVYSIGSRVASISLFVYTAFSGGWQYFAFSTMKDKDQVKLTSKVFEYLSIFTIILFMGAIILNKTLFELLFNDDFTKGYKVFPFLFLSPLILMLFQTVGNQLLIIKKTYLITVSLLFGVFINLLSNYFLTKNYGIVGSSLATLIAYYCSTVIMILICYKLKLIVIPIRLILAHGINFLMIYYLFVSANYEPFLQITLIGLILAVLYLKEIKNLSILLKNKMLKNN